MIAPFVHSMKKKSLSLFRKRVQVPADQRPLIILRSGLDEC